MIDDKVIDMDFDKAVYNFLKGSIKGVVKTMAKMGISTVASYRGAQIFETIGLATPLVNKYFSGTSSRCEGSGLDEIAGETLARHRAAFPGRHLPDAERALESGGVYQWRKDGEFHLFNPETIHLLQKSVRTGSYDVYKQYALKINDQSENLSTLRSLIGASATSANRCLSRKSNPWRKSPAASRPARCLSARFRRKPMRPSRSP